MIKSPYEILCNPCALIKMWAGLSKKELCDLLQEGAKLLMKVVSSKLEIKATNQDDERMMNLKATTDLLIVPVSFFAVS